MIETTEFPPFCKFALFDEICIPVHHIEGSRTSPFLVSNVNLISKFRFLSIFGNCVLCPIRISGCRTATCYIVKFVRQRSLGSLEFERSPKFAQVLMVHEASVSRQLLGASPSAPALLPPRRSATYFAHADPAMRFQRTLFFSPSCVGSLRFEADDTLSASPVKRSDTFAGTLSPRCTPQTIRQNLHVSLTRHPACDSFANFSPVP